MRIRRFSDMSIRSKLTLIIMATCSIALLLGYLALTARYVTREPDRLAERLTVLAEVMGANSTAAVAFNDRASAQRTLAALDAEPSIVAAYIYDNDGSIFASLNSRADQQAPRETGNASLADRYENTIRQNWLFSANLHVARPIVLDGETIGTIVVYADLRQLRAALLWDIGVISGVVLAVALVALMLSYQLQKVISEPILRLAATMKHLSSVKDYSLRVEKSSNDELGALIDGFNQMLEQIEIRDERLERHREQLEEAQRIAHLGHWDWDVSGDRFYLSDQAISILGLSRDRFDGSLNAIIACVHSEDRESVEQAYCAASIRKMPLDIEHRVVRGEKEIRFVHQRGEFKVDPVTERLHFAGTIQDVSERVLAEEKLRIAANALENTADSVMIMDSEKKIISVNQAFTNMTCYSREEVLNESPEFLRSDRHDDAFYSDIWSRVSSLGRWHGDIWGRRKTGEVYPQRVSVSEMKTSDGKASHYVSVSSDISQYKEYEARLEFMARHDALTHLPNRTMFQMQLEQALLHAQCRGGSLGLMFIDLDRFKTVNDSLGHAVGDELLCAVAARIRECLRETDVVARQGGDEFTVLLDRVKDVHDAAKIAQKLIDAVAQPFVIGGHELFISSSVGISCYPQDGVNADTLLKNADAAMYRAKQLGRNGYQSYSAQMSSEALEALVMSNSLRAAIERNELVVHYQPRIELASGKVTGMEALVRWQHPERGMIPPARFIPLAEETGLIEAIGEHVLRTACQQVKAWQDSGLPAVPVAVNISARQFRQGDFAQHISTILRESGLAARFLELEITESVMMQHHDRTRTVLADLNSIGITIAVDDFGTGYSSLAYLKRFPLHCLKIDQSFVRDLPGDPDDLAITKAIVTLAKSLKLKTVAEGVETMEQHAFLESCGCDEAQGYLYNKPLKVRDMEIFLRSQHTPLVSTAA